MYLPERKRSDCETLRSGLRHLLELYAASPRAVVRKLIADPCWRSGYCLLIVVELCMLAKWLFLSHVC